MRKTILSLVGTAALLSLINSSLALQERSPSGRKEVTDKGRKKGDFVQLEIQQRKEIEEYIAEDLAQVIGLTPSAVQSSLHEGKSVESILQENGLTLEDAQRKIDGLHREKIRMTLASYKEKGKLSPQKFEELSQKVLS